MAAGVYGGLASTPKLQEGFAAAGSFSRVAEMNFRKKEAERAEQRQIAAEGRLSITKAIEAGNVNMGDIEAGFRTTVGKLLDSYKEKILVASKKWEQSPTFANQLEITRIKTQFENNLGVFNGIGATSKALAENQGKYSPVLSASVYNGNADFMLGMPQMAQTFDPETMTVTLNGKTEHIQSMYNSMVDVSKLVPKTKLDEATEEYVGMFLNKDNQKLTEERQHKIQDPFLPL